MTMLLKIKLAVSALGVTIGVSAVTLGVLISVLIALKTGVALAAVTVSPIGLGISVGISLLALIISTTFLYATNRATTENKLHAQAMTAAHEVTERSIFSRRLTNQIANFNREMIFSVLMGMLSTAALVSIFILSGLGLVGGLTPVLIAVSVLPAVIALVEPLVVPAYKAVSHYFSSRSNTKVNQLNSLDPKGVDVGEGLFVTSPELLERRGVSPPPSLVAMYRQSQKPTDELFSEERVARTLDFGHKQA